MRRWGKPASWARWSHLRTVLSETAKALAEAQGAAFGEMVLDQFGSHERGERGISVHGDRAVWRAVESRATTSLPAPSRADNVLKHDT